MKKLVLGFCLLFTVNLYADLVANGFSQYRSNHYQDAIKLWTQACDNGNMDGCYNLAYMYANGKGTLHNEKKAAGLYKRNCDAGDSKACSNLGALYENGVGGIRQDFYKSSRLYAKSCNAGNVNGC